MALIATLQHRGAELASDAYPPYRVAFDVDKLTWELEFFVRHFLIAYRGATPSEAERERAARGVGGASSRSWPPSRVCCATAITTAAT